MLKEIKIAGGGIAGLVSAINLKRAGFEVFIFEKEKKIGNHYPKNPQLLPNWFSKKNILEEIAECGIKIKFLREIKEIEIKLPYQKIEIVSKKEPIGYVVLRGGKGSLEDNLRKIAEKAGVKFVNNFFVKEKDFQKFNIVAIGKSKILTIGYGQVFKGNFNPKKLIVSLDPKYSPSLGYCYLFPFSEKKAILKISKKFAEKISLKENLAKFKKEVLKSNEEFLYDFWTKRSFKIPKKAKINNTLFVGEAAGFQDPLFRFGLRYAIISGYLAAKAIIEGKNYDLLWKKLLLPEFKKINLFREIFEKIKKEGFKNLPPLPKTIQFEKIKNLWNSKKVSFILRVIKANPFFLKKEVLFLLEKLFLEL